MPVYESCAVFISGGDQLFLLRSNLSLGTTPYFERELIHPPDSLFTGRSSISRLSSATVRLLSPHSLVGTRI